MTSCRSVFSYFSEHDAFSVLMSMAFDLLFYLVGTGKNKVNTEGCRFGLGITRLRLGGLYVTTCVVL